MTMEPKKIIIRNDSSLPLVEACRLVESVVYLGLLREWHGAGRTTLCYATRFDVGGKRVMVYCRKNRSGSETFYVYAETEREGVT